MRQEEEDAQKDFNFIIISSSIDSCVWQEIQKYETFFVSHILLKVTNNKNAAFFV